MTELKSYLLRIPKDEFEIIEKNAKKEKRSINQHIAYHLAKEEVSQ